MINHKDTKMAAQRFAVPHGNTAVSVKVIDCTTISDVACKHQYTPLVDGLQGFRPAPALSFLLEHPSGKKYLWDLGVPSDLDTLGPQVAERLKKVSYTIEPADVADTLTAAGVPLESITGVIWRYVLCRCKYEHEI